MRGALTRGDFAAAENWLNEARTIGHAGEELKAADTELIAAREQAAQSSPAVGASALQRIHYVAPKYPAAIRTRGITGWVELEFTVRVDGSTGDIAVTNSYPRGTFNAVARDAVGEWRYKPVMRDGRPVEQRYAVRIRFAGE
jgi:TonB family protein